MTEHRHFGFSEPTIDQRRQEREAYTAALAWGLFAGLILALVMVLVAVHS